MCTAEGGAPPAVSRRPTVTSVIGGPFGAALLACLYVALASAVFWIVGWPMSALANYRGLFESLDYQIVAQIRFVLTPLMAGKTVLMAVVIGIFWLTVIVSVIAAIAYPWMRLPPRARWPYLGVLVIGGVMIALHWYPRYPRQVSVNQQIDRKLRADIAEQVAAWDNVRPGTGPAVAQAVDWATTYVTYTGTLVRLHFFALFILVAAIGAISWAAIRRQRSQEPADTLPGDARVLLLLCSAVTSLFLLTLSASQERYLYGFEPLVTSVDLERAPRPCHIQTRFGQAVGVLDPAECLIEEKRVRLRKDIQYLVTAQSLQSAIVFTLPVLFVSVLTIIVSERMMAGAADPRRTRRSLLQSAVLPLYVAFGVKLLSIAIMLAVS